MELCDEIRVRGVVRGRASHDRLPLGLTRIGRRAWSCGASLGGVMRGLVAVGGPARGFLLALAHLSSTPLGAQGSCSLRTFTTRSMPACGA